MQQSGALVQEQSKEHEDGALLWWVFFVIIDY